MPLPHRTGDYLTQGKLLNFVCPTVAHQLSHSLVILNQHHGRNAHDTITAGSFAKLVSIYVVEVNLAIELVRDLVGDWN